MSGRQPQREPVQDRDVATATEIMRAHLQRTAARMRHDERARASPVT
jgi:DNA-binding GntR family transcriptional regulator